MTRSVKNAAGSFLRCIDAIASLAQAFSSVNSDFQNVQSCFPVSDYLPGRMKVLTSVTDRCSARGGDRQLYQGIAAFI